MNNKGFTLIELLAVVILLITISLFVMPRIVDVIKDGDKTKEDIAKNKIIESAKEYASNYDTNFLNDLVNVGDTKSISKEDLLNSKLIDAKDIENISFVKVKVILKEDNKLEYILSDIAIETTYLTINLDGGTGENKSGEYEVGTTITLNTPSKEGYAFSHWQVVSGNSILSGNILTIGTTSTTIKAVWIKKLTITLDLDGGLTNQTLNSNYTTGLTITLETPTKSGFTFAGWTIVSGDSAISGNSLTVGTLDTTIKANWIANNYDFAYTGDAQIFTAPQDGKYEIELWGASGGFVTSDSGGWSNEAPGDGGIGGYGGYTKGTITLSKGEILYVYVGEGGTQGTVGVAATSTVGQGAKATFNGGGKGGNAGGGSYPYQNYAGGYSGGGATDIRLVSGTWNDITSLRSRIMVAGGGGGFHNSKASTTIVSSDISVAGGLISEKGQTITSYSGTSYSYGAGALANQTSGNAFGVGGTGSNTGVSGYCNGHNGGGGGYYGGGGAPSTDGNCFRLSGGGGSSYISGHTGSVAVTSASDTTAKSGCTTGTTDNSCSIHYSGKVFKNTVMIDGRGYLWTNIKGSQVQMPKPEGGKYDDGTGNVGNGYARIKYVENSSNVTEYNNIGIQTFTAQKTGKYKLEVWGASGGGTGENVSAGYGGYSTGQITLNKGEVIYIVIGGKGGTTQAPTSQVNGGYNGGGSGFSADKYGVNNYGSGGGATHIAKVSGTLSELSNNISSILIVAGGGGGSAYYKNGTEYYHYGSGGSGGGYNGVNSYNYYSSTQVVKTALGGSQTLINSNENIITNGSFGTGANGTEASGGGGGFYGGQTAHLIGSAGGSGYIGNSLLTNKVMYCYNCTASSDTETKTISTTCANGTATENCAKKGNGYAKITYIGE